MIVRRWYFKHGTRYEEFNVLYDNGMFMLVQNRETKAFSFGLCADFGTLFGFPVNWSCLTKDQAIELLQGMIRADSIDPELDAIWKKQYGYTESEQWQARL